MTSIVDALKNNPVVIAQLDDGQTIMAFMHCAIENVDLDEPVLFQYPLIIGVESSGTTNAKVQFLAPLGLRLSELVLVRVKILASPYSEALKTEYRYLVASLIDQTV
jgi:hypothetical protein